MRQVSTAHLFGGYIGTLNLKPEIVDNDNNALKIEGVEGTFRLPKSLIQRVEYNDEDIGYADYNILTNNGWSITIAIPSSVDDDQEVGKYVWKKQQKPILALQKQFMYMLVLICFIHKFLITRWYRNCIIEYSCALLCDKKKSKRT